MDLCGALARCTAGVFDLSPKWGLSRKSLGQGVRTFNEDME
jgi:hypothetical protein